MSGAVESNNVAKVGVTDLLGSNQREHATLKRNPRTKKRLASREAIDFGDALRIAGLRVDPRKLAVKLLGRRLRRLDDWDTLGNDNMPGSVNRDRLQ